MKECKNFPSVMIKNNILHFRCFLKDQSARRGRPFSDQHWLDEVPTVSSDNGKNKKNKKQQQQQQNSLTPTMYLNYSKIFFKHLHQGGANLFTSMLVMFLICVFQNERLNRFLCFLTSLINNNGTLRNVIYFLVGIYLKPHF